MANKIRHLAVIAMLISSMQAQAGTINTVQIVADSVTAAPKCLHYQVKGVCFWALCFGPLCKVTTTLYVDHYLPDTFVSVYRDKDSNPWDLGQKVLDPIAYKIGNEELKYTLHFPMGWGNSPTNNPHDLDTHFKEVDVVGNPATLVFRHFGMLLLPSMAQSFQPYYSSLWDAAVWRSTWTEMFYPGSLVPGIHEVGTFFVDDWGSVYPRSGFLNQPNDAKGAAVFVQRAADIVTRTTQPHLYVPLRSGDCGEQCQVSEAKENDGNSIQWQMVYPTNETSCTVFGHDDVTSITPWGSDAAIKGNGNYVWVMWRHYQGCIHGDGKFIGKVTW